MPGTSYSYLDLTVLPELRRKVLSGDATILFTSDMHAIIWANAAGARLFGGSGISEMIASPLNPRQAFVSQLAAAATQIDSADPIVRGFRVARGLRTELIQCEMSRVALPDGDEAILLSCRDDKISKPMREHELAENAVDSLAGFADAAAILDDYGLPLAATSSFAELEIDPEELAVLVREASHETDRLIKRAQALADGTMLGIGIARIGDRPGRYLVVCATGSDNDADDREVGDGEVHASTDFPVGEDVNENDIQATHFDDDYLPETGSGEAGHDRVPEDFVEEQLFHPGAAAMFEPGEQHNESDLSAPWDAALNEAIDEDRLHDEDDIADLQRLDGVEAPEDDDGEENIAETARPAPAVMTRTTPQAKSLIERWYSGISTETPTHADRPDADSVSDSFEDLEVHEETSDEAVPEAVASGYETALVDDDADLVAEDATEDSGQDDGDFVYQADGQPVRFAWIIDGDQVFRSVSPELAQTVGPNASDIIGRRWSDVARVFGFDRSGDIGRLLEKRDTWSGKSVFWPVQGTDLAVPIDLAALPAFDSNRRFDGFRGFGIIRTSDAIVDPEETGRSLASRHNVIAFEPGEDKVVEDRSWSAPTGEEAYFDWDDDAKDVSPGEDGETGETGPSSVNARQDDSRDTVSDRDQDRFLTRGNVVELTSRFRNDSGDALNRRESQAFSEIGKKLREDELGSEDPATHLAMQKNGDDMNVHDAAPLEPEFDLAGDEIVEDDAEAVDTTAARLGGTYHDKDHDGDHDGDHDPEVAKPGHVNTSILEQLPAPVLVYRNGATLFVNDEMLKLSGYADRDEFARAGGIDAILSGTEDDDEPGQSSRLLRKDGSSVPINPLLQSVPWDGGKALLLTFRTVAGEAKEAVSERAALDIARVSELQNILDTATDGIILIDRDGEVESVNASAEALFGTDFDKAKGRNLTEFFAQESHKTINDYIAELTQPGVAGILNDGREVIGKESNGGLIPLFITIGRMGSESKLCLVLRDMTQWKKAEEDLVGARRSAEIASEQKSDFLARVSHEIRTPLNAIIGFSDIMIEERFGPVGNERYREYLRDINRSGVHVLDLINDLLDISKIEAGKMELTYEAVDLNQIASETVALLQPQANRERIIIRTSLSRAVPRVVADARSIRQIILNLVSNAIKFTPMNGQVIVSTVYEGNGEVALRVRDTGRGMSEKEIETAMKPFQQIGAVEEKRGQGTGLGLPLTKALVEANRAYFDIESKPGEGTIAHVHFPIQRVLAD